MILIGKGVAPEVDPENELGGGQFRGLGDESPPAGSRGRAVADDFSQLKASWGEHGPFVPPLKYASGGHRIATNSKI